MNQQRTFSIAIALVATSALHAQAIRQHSGNLYWLEWRGRATVLITSDEHYGAVLNPDFDFRRYLETLERDGMNYTRIFAGSYVEPPGAFGIQRNTLAPAPARFLAPWARSDRPGYAGGGNKFDLGRFSPEYLSRLKEFIREGGNRGLVVELTLFSSRYGEKQWAVHPFNPANNIQALAVPGWEKLHVLPPGGDPADARSANPAFPFQEALTRWLVRELDGFDNLFLEIQNEPWSDNHTMGDLINPYMTDRHSFPNAVEVTEPGLEVNVESFELTPIRVAVGTPEGTLLPGYGFDECRADYDARRIYTPVRWQSKPDLSELRGKTIKLHFEIQGAALYAYRLVPQPAR